MSEDFPTRPSDISLYLTLQELAERSAEHLTPLIAAPHRTEHLHPDTLAAHALAWLAYRTELAERASHGRWVTAVDALAAGASLEQVGEAMGVKPAAVRDGIAAWASGQRYEGFIDHDRYEQVMALLTGQVPE